MFELAEGLQTSQERHCCMKLMHLNLNTKYDIPNVRTVHVYKEGHVQFLFYMLYIGVGVGVAQSKS